MITFRPTYPGSPVEQAYLGAVVVGGLYRDGKYGAWCCALPTEGQMPLFWNRADRLGAARAALIKQVESWCQAAGVDAADLTTRTATIARIHTLIARRRETFRLAVPGSDEEYAAYLDALDFALGVLAQEQANIDSEGARDE